MAILIRIWIGILLIIFIEILILISMGILIEILIMDSVGWPNDRSDCLLFKISIQPIYLPSFGPENGHLNKYRKF